MDSNHRLTDYETVALDQAELHHLFCFPVEFMKEPEIVESRSFGTCQV